MPRTEQPSPAAKIFLILAFAAAGMACLLALLPAAGHDQMWLLYAARLMLHGAPLYGSQVFETNPPLIVWLSAVPAALSGLTGIADTALGKLFVLLLEFSVGALCLRLLRVVRAEPVRPGLSRTAVYGLTFAYICIVAVMPARDFGQRDHFLALFLLPYLFAAGVRAEGRALSPWLAALIGVLGLAGVVLKPHQLLVVVVVEGALLLFRAPGESSQRVLQRLLRPEMLSMFTAGLMFLAAVRVFAPLYFSVIVPIERDTYWAYGQRTLPQLFIDSIQLHILGAVTLALLAHVGWRSTSALARLLALAGVAATVAFYIQGTGWYYHQLPALTFFGCALAIVLLEWSERRPFALPGWTVEAAGGLAVLALALTAHFMNYPFTAERSFPLDAPDAGFFAGLAPGTPVLTLSPTIDDTLQPIYKFHLTLGQRYPALLMMPALLRSESGPAPKHRLQPERVAELDRMQHQFMVEDLNRWHPAMILVQRCQDPAVHCQVLEDRHDNLLAFFLRDPAFAAIFSRYHLWRTSGSYDAYLPN